MNYARRRAVFSVVCGALSIALAGCFLLPTDSGTPNPGNGLPPIFNGGNGNANGNGGPNANGGGDTLVFDVNITANTVNTTGINVDAVFTAVLDSSQANGEQPYVSVTLRDTFNDPTSEVGLAGGLYLTATNNTLFTSSGPFQLEAGIGGLIRAEFVGNQPGAITNKFYLDPDAISFVPDQIGTAFTLDAESSFTFIIENRSIIGTLVLRGTAQSSSGITDVYEGSFQGTLR